MKMSLVLLPLVAFCFIAIDSACAQDEGPLQLRAGTAAVDITPRKLPVSMTGSFQDRMATGVQDRLYARALVLDDGSTKIGIVVCDSCLISRDIFGKAKQIAAERTGIAESHLLMSSTHTHTAATAVPLAQCHPAPEYVTFLTSQIAEAVVQAHERLQPAGIGWASGKEPDEVGNRRWHVKPEGIAPNPFGRSDDKVRTNAAPGSDILIKPAGPVDPEVAIVSVIDNAGKPLSLLGNYGLHYVGSVTPYHLSADYFGEFARRVGDKLHAGENFVGMLSNGASGDVNNYNFLHPRPRAEPMQRIAAVGNRIADVAVAARAAIDHKKHVRLTMVERTLDLGVRKPDADDLAYARTLLADAENPESLTVHEVYAQETVLISETYPETVTIKLQALRIGDVLGIVAIPCEVFAEIGLEIKQRSPFKTSFVISLANGYYGYLPTPAQHQLGGYETWRSGWSYLEVDASTKITEAVLSMLESLK